MQVARGEPREAVVAKVYVGVIECSSHESPAVAPLGRWLQRPDSCAFVEG